MRYTNEEIRSMASRIEEKLNRYYFENGADYYTEDEDEDGRYPLLDLNLDAKLDQYIEDAVEGDELPDDEFSELAQAIHDAMSSNLETELEEMVMEMLKDQADAHQEMEFMRRDNRDFI